MKLSEKLVRFAMAAFLVTQLIPQPALAEIAGDGASGNPAQQGEVMEQDQDAPGDAADPAPIADEGTQSTVQVNSFKMKWLPNNSSSNTVSDDGKAITLTPTSVTAGQTYAMAQYELTFTGRDSDMLPVGSVEVRVPAHIFKGWDGEIMKDIPVQKKASGKSVTEPSGPEAPGQGTENAFNWYYDAETDEIVYKNFREMSVHEGFTVRVQYQVGAGSAMSSEAYDVAGASYSVKNDAAGISLDGQTGDLKVGVTTVAPKVNAYKSFNSKFEKWQSKWGPEPANSADYYYVVWTASAYPKAPATMPYSLYFDETQATNSEANPGQAPDGDLIAWTTGDGRSKWVQSYTTADGQVLTGAEGMKADPVRVDSTYSGSSVYRDLVVRYPRTSLAGGTSPKVSNRYVATVVGKDGSKNQAFATASYVYQTVSFGYNSIGGAGWTSSKGALANDTLPFYSSRDHNGGLSMLRNGMPYKGGSWITQIENHQAAVGADGVPLPKDQQPDYGSVIRDGELFIAGEQLDGKNADNPDYQIDSFRVSKFDEYDLVTDEEKGLTYALSNDYAGYHPIEVLVRTRDNNEWHSIGTVTKKSSSGYQLNGADPVDNKFGLPEGTYDIKFVHMGNQAKVEYRMSLYDTLYPTEHVMSLIGDDTTSFDLFNIDNAYVTDKDGKIISGGNKPTSSSTPGIKETIEKNDAAEYGADADKIVHSYAKHLYKSFSGTSSFGKSMSLLKEDTNAGLERVRVNMQYYDRFDYGNLGLPDQNAAIDLNVINEQREAKFYDLLPVGTSVDLSTIEVGPAVGSYSGSGFSGDSTSNFVDSDGNRVYMRDYDYTVEMVDNWRGSGQTMLIITAKAPDGFRNIDKSDFRVQSGFKCRFTLIDTFENIATNGGTLANSGAVASQDGSLSNGRPDDGGTGSNKDLLSGLNEAGGDLDGAKNTMYSDSTIKVNPTLGSEFKFKKLVKGADDATYRESTKIPAAGAYSYQLLVKNDTNNKQTGIVLYDILESAYDTKQGEKPHWEGTLTGVDCTQASKLGADVKVYYSTATGWDGLGDRAKLDNTDIWSTTPPADLSTVTAVAFDCSEASATADAKHKDAFGNFVLPAEESLACYLYMRAPENYQDYQDDPATPEDETHKAYNSAYSHTVRYNADDPIDGTGAEGTTESSVTTVELDGPAGELSKTSDPASGTAAKPKKVQAGDHITYTLDVRNKGLAEAITDVTVIDDVPAGLLVDLANIKYYSNDHKSALKPCDGTGVVKVEKNGQKLTFTISKVAARETIHLVIPTTVDVSANAGMTYDNDATMTSYNGKEWDIVSETTHHASDPATTSVDAKKVWSDGNDQHGLRQEHVTVQLEADGANTGAPVQLDATNGWVHTFSDLPKYQADGQTEIHYTVSELETFPLYNTSYSTEPGTGAEGAPAKTLVVTNALRTVTNENVRFTVHKLRAADANPVAGVTFGLYSDAACTQLVGEAQVTDASGNVTFEMHPADGTTADFDLYVKELSAPHGYQVDSTPQKITMHRPDQPNITVNRAGNVVEYDYDWSATPAEGSLLSGSNNMFRMSNAYTPDPTSLTLTAKKTITDESGRPGEKNFTFTLAPEGNAPAPAAKADGVAGDSVTVTGEGTADFGTITFTEPGTYQYVVAERNDGEPGYTYAAPHEVTVHVVDVDGVLQHTWSDDGAQQTDGTPVTFGNAYKAASVSTALSVSKRVTGCPRTEGLEKTFVFQLSAPTGAPMPAGAAGARAEVTDSGTDAAATGTFGGITYTKPGTYLYEIVETKDAPAAAAPEPDDQEGDKVDDATSANGYPGYFYDTNKVYAQVVVSDHNGQLVVDSAEYGRLIAQDGQMVFQAARDQADAMTFVNEYAPVPAKVTIPVTKVVTGEGAPSDTPFEFVLTSQPGADGSSSVVPMPSTGDGGPDAGIDAPKVDPEPGIDLAADLDGVPAPETATLTRVGAGNSSFAEITYTQPGTYRYTLAETAGDVTGFTYDARVHVIVVTVTDADDGTLTASWTIDGEAATDAGVTFTNVYHPLPTEGTVGVAKRVTGTQRTEGLEKTFSFQLSAIGDAPMPAEATAQLTDTLTDEAATGDFGQIQFTEPGTYYYQVSESCDDPYPGYAYDQRSVVVQVVVTDHAGQLEVDSTTYGTLGTEGDVATFQAAEDQTEGMTFVNEYAPTAAELAIPVTKVVKGDGAPNDATFSFELAPAGEDEVPVPDSTTATVTGAGSTAFGAIAFDAPGTYAYTVAETAGTQKGFTYDTTVHQVVVTVTDADDGTLSAGWTIDGEAATDVGVTFTNTFQKDEAPTGEKNEKADKHAVPATGDAGAAGAVALAALGLAVLIGRRRMA